MEVALVVTSMDLVADVVDQGVVAVVAEECLAGVDLVTRAGVAAEEEEVVILE